jgi:acetylornithine/N-succinyldiaminopimelate aminotransferase
MGRCGHVLASEHYGVRADITIMSKALGGGIPLGAVLMTEAVAAALSPGMHGCTFGGNPVATAAGGFLLDKVNQPKFLAGVKSRAKTMEKQLKALVKRHPSLAEARGLGLLRAVELKPDAPYTPADLVKAARDEKLLLIRGGERAVRLLPPLNVKPAEITEAIARLDRALTKLETPTQEK